MLTTRSLQSQQMRLPMEEQADTGYRALSIDKPCSAAGAVTQNILVYIDPSFTGLKVDELTME